MIDRDYIFELISEMAESDGLSPRDFIENLYAERSSGALPELDEALRSELEEARLQRTKNRYDSFESGVIEKDIAEFRRLFPDVVVESIPESVWDEAAKGVGLAAAYALNSAGRSKLDEKAAQTNAFNNARSAHAAFENDGEEHLSEKQVAAMKPSEVKRNYKSILKSMKKW